MSWQLPATQRKESTMPSSHLLSTCSSVDAARIVHTYQVLKIQSNNDPAVTCWTF